MKIQYISCHSVLEYDEVRLLAKLGYDVKSNGAYRDPRGAYTLPRPGIPEISFDQEFFDLTGAHPKTQLPPELIEPFDVIIIMAGLNESILTNNWDRIKHKRVIWRSIGQNTPQTERLLKKYRAEGLEIVRYSPMERGYDDYVGEDALIRFPKDPEVYGPEWVGGNPYPVNFTQSLKARGSMAHYDEIMSTLVGFGGKVYGPGNENLGPFNGGDLPFDQMIDTIRRAGCFVYGGTWPAPYTLSVIEAMMIGVPIVAISQKMAQIQNVEQFPFYEVEDILAEAGIKTFDTVKEMRDMVKTYIDTPLVTEQLSKDERKLANELFGYDVIGPQWREYLERGPHAN